MLKVNAPLEELREAIGEHGEPGATPISGVDSVGIAVEREIA